MYEALKRNGYFVPQSHKDPFMSWSFMDGVRQGVHWLPKTSEIRYFDVASTPTKQKLAEIVVQAIDKHHSLVQHPTFKATCDRLHKVPPSTSFLLCILGTIDPKHAIFAKDYRRLLK